MGNDLGRRSQRSGAGTRRSGSARCNHGADGATITRVTSLPRSLAVSIALTPACFDEASDGESGPGSETAASASSSGGTSATAGSSDGSTTMSTTADMSSSTAADDTTAASSGAAVDSSDTGETATDESGSGGPRCGDGVIDEGEMCDTDEIGSVTCPPGEVGPPACNESCQIDLAPCCLPAGAACVLNLGGECCSGSCGLDLECN